MIGKGKCGFKWLHAATENPPPGPASIVWRRFSRAATRRDGIRPLPSAVAILVDFTFSASHFFSLFLFWFTLPVKMGNLVTFVLGCK